ncbi:uncharacterized protein LOC132192611 [Neocloeon triangulifer]|uniref:uncharacterized protein LOC132192611 n=1 Tax=Neocloeon triangulifer TaxID=2078957 RepID=UPI00286F1B22|nr:uncharacterized protein LOC132192611 [Neocloeon triangulifer]
MQTSMQKICTAMGSHRTFLLGRSLNVQQTAGLKRSVEAKLGIPSKPVKPLSAFFRFAAQLRPNLLKSHPDLKATQVSKVAGVEWLKLNAQQKQQYETPYKKEYNTYLQAMDKYKSSLTEEHKSKINEAEQEIKQKKTRREIKQKSEELGKPKKPASSFILYLQENASKRGDTPVKDWVTKVGESWKKLSAAEKAKYETRGKQLRKDYVNNLEKWEDKMVRQGNLALVRTGVMHAKQAKAIAKSTKNTLVKKPAAKKKIFTLMGRHRTFLLGRSLNLQQATSFVTRATEDKYGLPKRPMRPTSPFFKFLAQIRPELAKTHPSNEILKLASMEWKKVGGEQRQQWQNDYKKDLAEYQQAVENFKNHLTEEQKNLIQIAEQKVKNVQVKKALKKLRKEQNKPKKPLPSFMVYRNESLKNRGDVPMMEWTSKVAQAWREMSKEEKEKYNAARREPFKDYQEKCQLWEEEMIKTGNVTLVRAAALKSMLEKALKDMKGRTIRKQPKS